MGGGAEPLPRRPTAFTSATLAADSSDTEDDEANRSRYLPTMEVDMVTIPDAPLRPMGPGDLIARATEMLASFDADKVSPDAHAQRCLSEWRVRETSDATFITQCFHGCVRYAKMLGVFSKTMYHTRASDILRSDKDLYTVYAYLMLLRLDELGWDQFLRLLASNPEQKMLPLLKFAFDEKVLDDLLRDQWLKIYDPPWVDNVLASLLSWRHEADELIARYEDEVHFAKIGDVKHKAWMTTDALEQTLEGNGGGQKGPRVNNVTVPEPFKLHPPKPKPLPAEYKPPPKPRPKPVPPSNKPLWEKGEMTAEQREVKRAEELNARRASEKLEEANRMAFKLTAVERPTNLEAVRAEVEAERAAHYLAAKGESFRARPMPSFYEEWENEGNDENGSDAPPSGEPSPSKRPEIKLNAAAILREDALYKKKQAEEAKMLETFELDKRDTREFTEWQRTMRLKDEEARRRKVDALKKEMEAAFEKAVAAREQAVVQNAAKRETVRAESHALRLRREELVLIEEQKAKERKAYVLAIEAEARRKREERLVKNKASGEVRLREKAETAARLSERRREDRERKADLCRKIRALELKPKAHVKDHAGQKSVLSKTYAVPMLEDMSVAELKERLVRSKRIAEKEEQENRVRIAAERADRAALVNEKRANIERIRSIAGEQGTKRRTLTQTERAAKADALARKNAIEAEQLQRKLDAKRAERARLTAEKSKRDAAAEFKGRRIMGASEETRAARKDHELVRAKERKAYEIDRRIQTEQRFAEATRRRERRARGDAKAREDEMDARYVARYDAKVATLTTRKVEETEETLRRKRDAVARGRLREEQLRTRLGPVKAGIGPGFLQKTGQVSPHRHGIGGGFDGTYGGSGKDAGAYATGERPARDFLISGPLKAPGEGTRVHRTLGPDGSASVGDAHLRHE